MTRWFNCFDVRSVDTAGGMQLFWAFTCCWCHVCCLVVSLQVKADKDSANLHRLQQASRGVTQATAAVVASTKSGKSQIEETGERVTFTRLNSLVEQPTVGFWCYLCWSRHVVIIQNVWLLSFLILNPHCLIHTFECGTWKVFFCGRLCRYNGLLQHDSHTDQTTRDGCTGKEQERTDRHWGKYPSCWAT